MSSKERRLLTYASRETFNGRAVESGLGTEPSVCESRGGAPLSKKKTKDRTGSLGFEAKLWEAADLLPPVSSARWDN